MTQIGKLKPESKFMYSGRMYQIIGRNLGDHPRFKIQEYGVTGYRKLPNRIYAFCFPTGALGSFDKDTSVRPVYTVTMPIPIGVTPMTDSPCAPNINSEEQERRFRNVRNLALKILVEKYQIWEQKRDEVKEAKDRREQAADAYAKARDIAYDLVKEGQIETGSLVRGTYIIQIFHNSINVQKAEILE